ncbi:hypothetical protein [Micromonospora sp. RV43]|uniref:hypothetical protein n=1 Tax=Micromonospora sp. RV43 TaxID=1661387 RepID=UPI00064C1319|nr:hypothetical protein [Micromonospora sp. RV43]
MTAPTVDPQPGCGCWQFGAGNNCYCERPPAAGPQPGHREYIVIVPSIIGGPSAWSTTYAPDPGRHPSRQAAIDAGWAVREHDDWLIAVVSGESLVGLAWMFEDRDDAEELADVARALGLAFQARTS